MYKISFQLLRPNFFPSFINQHAFNVKGAHVYETTMHSSIIKVLIDLQPINPYYRIYARIDRKMLKRLTIFKNKIR